MKLVHTTDYLLLVDEKAEIKVGELFIDLRSKILYEEDLYRPIHKEEAVFAKSIGAKIIAYYPLTKEAKELDLPLLPNFLIEDVEDNLKIHEWVQEVILKEGKQWNDQDALEPVYYGIVKGFNEARKDRQFSLEDMKKAIEMARLITDNGVEGTFDTESLSGYEEVCTYGLKDKYTSEEIIKSLSIQQLPKEFVPEYYTNGDLIVKNRNGIRELIGTYKY